MGKFQKHTINSVINNRAFIFDMDGVILDSETVWIPYQDDFSTKLFGAKIYKKNPKILLKSLYSPFEIYLIVNNVTGLGKGIYHLDFSDYSLDILRLGNYGKQIAHIAQGQMFIADAPVVFLISSVFKRYMFRYRQARTYRDLFTSTAELAQLIIIYSSYFDIKAFETPALRDIQLQTLLNLNEWEEEILYLLALGK